MPPPVVNHWEIPADFCHAPRVDNSILVLAQIPGKPDVATLNLAGVTAGCVLIYDPINNRLASLTAEQVTALNNIASHSAAGLMSVADKTKLDNLSGNFALPVATSSILGGVRAGVDCAITGAGYIQVISGANHGHTASQISGLGGAVQFPDPNVYMASMNVANGSTKGLMSASDKTKLDGLGGGNYALPAASGSVLGGIVLSGDMSWSGGSVIVSSGAHHGHSMDQIIALVSSNDGIIAALSQIQVALYPTNIMAGLAVATVTSKGVMSAADKAKLDGMGGGNYSLPNASTSVKGGIVLGNDITWTGGGTVVVSSGLNHTHARAQIAGLDAQFDGDHIMINDLYNQVNPTNMNNALPLATTSVKGLLSASEKAQIALIAGIQAQIVPATYIDTLRIANSDRSGIMSNTQAQALMNAQTHHGYSGDIALACNNGWRYMRFADGVFSGEVYGHYT